MSCASSNAYGRIIRDSEDNVIDIVEKKQIDRMEENASKHFGCKTLSKQQLYQVDEFNSGIVIACSKPYFDALGNIYANLVLFLLLFRLASLLTDQWFRLDKIRLNMNTMQRILCPS